MVADDLDHPPLTLGGGVAVDRVHEILEFLGEIGVPLGVEVVAPDGLDGVDVDLQVVDDRLIRGLFLRV